jgi:hypothetical protein
VSMAYELWLRQMTRSAAEADRFTREYGVVHSPARAWDKRPPADGGRIGHAADRGRGRGGGRAGRDDARELFFRRRTPSRTAATEAERAANRIRRSATYHHAATAAEDCALRTQRSSSGGH